MFDLAKSEYETKKMWGRYLEILKWETEKNAEKFEELVIKQMPEFFKLMDRDIGLQRKAVERQAFCDLRFRVMFNNIVKVADWNDEPITNCLDRVFQKVGKSYDSGKFYRYMLNEAARSEKYGDSSVVLFGSAMHSGVRSYSQTYGEFPSSDYIMEVQVKGMAASLGI